MENIFTITISDFSEKIHFFNMKPTSNFEENLKITKSLNKSLTANYIPDFISKNTESRLMDTTINNTTKAKITIIGDIVIYVLYDPNIDINYINSVNARLIEALHILIKTKRLKIEMLIKKYMETLLLLNDAMYMFDPRIRLNIKNENMNLKEIINHSMFSQKFQKAEKFLRNLSFQHSSKDFSVKKSKIEDVKKIRIKISNTKFGLNEAILEKAKANKMNLLQSYGQENSDSNEVRNKKFLSFPSINSKDVNKITNLDIDFSQISIPVTNSNKNNQSFDNYDNSNNKNKSLNTSYNIMPNINNFDNINKFRSTNEMQIDSLKLNNFAGLNLHDSPIKKNHKSNSICEVYQSNSRDNIDKSVSSLKNIDLGNVLNSINFSNEENNNLDNSILNSSTINDYQGIDFCKNKNNLNMLSPVKLVKPIPVVSSNFDQRDNNNVNNVNKKSEDIFSLNLNNIFLSNTQIEDKFDIHTIKKQIRGVIIEKGILLNNKGKYEDVKYRGQIALELSNNFSIKNKTLFLKAFHPYWNDNSLFNKLIADKQTVEDQNYGNYKITCQNTRGFLRLIDYNINIKMIESVVEFKVNGQHKDNKYKLEIFCVLTEKMRNLIKSSQMIIVIMIKTSDIKILKSTDSSYTIEDKKITFTLNNFSNSEKFLIGMIFETQEVNLVEVIKVMYRYMDVLPTSNSAELNYLNELGEINYLDIIKKSMVEIRFIP